MCVDGIDEWGIRSMTFPITYGRYKSTVPKAFQSIEQKQSKYSYM